jgi:hypothetical protein
MRSVFLGLLLTLLATAVQAACPTPDPNLNAPPFVDGCPLWAQGLNKMAPLTSTGAGLFINLAIPPNPVFSSWLSSTDPGFLQGKHPYGYLGQYALAAGVSNYGEMGITGASRTSDVGSGSCCAIGLAGAAVNNHPTKGTAWPLYTTGLRQAGSSAVQNELVVANMSNEVVDVGPFQGSVVGPPGSSITLVLEAGGEPPVVGMTPTGAISAYMMLQNNSSFARHGIVFGANMFDPAYCTTNCPAIDMPYGYEIRWARDGSDTYGSFIRGSNNTSLGNGIDLTRYGALFKTGAGDILGVVANPPDGVATGFGYVQLAAGVDGATISIGTGNGLTNGNLNLAAIGTGVVNFMVPTKFSASSVGAGTQTFTNSPCGGTTTARWVPILITGQTGLWYIPACQ